MVYVAASSYGCVVGEELEGDYFEDGEQELVGLGDADHMHDKLGDVLVSLDGYGDDAAGAGGAGGYFLDRYVNIGGLGKLAESGGFEPPIELLVL